MTDTRQTKYSKEVLAVIEELGHASNAAIIERIKVKFPDVSATTIHRVTTRLRERGQIGLAPADSHGAARFDAVTVPHDHFACRNCDGLRDIYVAEHIRPLISRQLGGCKISGRLLVYGSCESCELERGRN